MTIRRRKDNEPPLATAKWGWKYHHTGIPVKRPITGEVYLPQFKLFVGGFSTSPYGIEFMRYEDDSPVNELIITNPHVAFEVDDLDRELNTHDFNIITVPNSPGDGTRVAMIEHDGAIIELIEFRGKFKPRK